MLLQEQSGVENKTGSFALTMLLTLPVGTASAFCVSGGQQTVARLAGQAI